MDNHEHKHNAEEQSHTYEQVDTTEEYNTHLEPISTSEAEEYNTHLEPVDTSEAYDYDREPPLDSITTSSNRKRSKYVFMTLCFLLALILLYTYITNRSTGDWFPLVGAIVLGVMGVIFLRSPDSPTAQQATTENTLAADLINTDQKATRTLSLFEELVQEALATIPEEFHSRMDNVMVQVKYEPDKETLKRVGVNEGHTLLGLYEGVPLTTYGQHYAPYPEIITIYQRPIEDYCHLNAARVREQVRTTVLHEVAHHFGMGHEEMPIWVK